MLNSLVLPTACYWRDRCHTTPYQRQPILHQAVQKMHQASSKSQGGSPGHPLLGVPAASGPAVDGTGGSPTKKRRVDWQWQCPACGNKQASGSKLLLHMHKCCGDLLPSTCDLTHVHSWAAQDSHSKRQTASRQLHPQESTPNTPQQQDGQHQGQQQQVQQPRRLDSSIQQQNISTGELQQLLAAASDSEHILRMRALRLRFISDGEQQAAHHSGNSEEEAEDPCSTAATAPSSQQQQRQSARAEPSQAAAVAAAAVLAAADRATAGDAADVGASSSQPAVKKRGRLRSSGRTPVRSIDEVVQELQLPKARWVIPVMQLSDCCHAVLHGPSRISLGRGTHGGPTLGSF